MKAYIFTTYPAYVLRTTISYCISRGIILKIIIDEGYTAIRSLITGITLSTVLQKKDCRPSRGYATTNINSTESFLPINSLVSPEARDIIIIII